MKNKIIGMVAVALAFLGVGTALAPSALAVNNSVTVACKGTYYLFSWSYVSSGGNVRVAAVRFQRTSGTGRIGDATWWTDYSTTNGHYQYLVGDGQGTTDTGSLTWSSGVYESPSHDIYAEITDISGVACSAASYDGRANIT
jgi:hypothetical protein